MIQWLNKVGQTLGAREDDYGEVTRNFEDIARGWSLILGVDVKPWQVTQCMVWLKLMREKTEFKDDSWVDIVGYTAIGRVLREHENGLPVAQRGPSLAEYYEDEDEDEFVRGAFEELVNTLESSDTADEMVDAVYDYVMREEPTQDDLKDVFSELIKAVRGEDDDDEETEVCITLGDVKWYSVSAYNVVHWYNGYAILCGAFPHRETVSVVNAAITCEECKRKMRSMLNDEKNDWYMSKGGAVVNMPDD